MDYQLEIKEEAYFDIKQAFIYHEEISQDWGTFFKYFRKLFRKCEALS